MHITKLRLLFCLSAALTAGTLFGQGLTGSISGLVKDPNGAVIPKAKVSARNVATNAEIQTLTDDTGFYRILNLDPAEYTITAEASGFRRTTTAPLQLNISQALRVDVSLEIGQVTETVTVNTSVSQINTEDAQLGQTVVGQGLPNISGAGGRNPLNLIGLQSGVVTPPPTGFSTNMGFGTPSINGQRTQANNYLLDGVDSNDLSINIPDALAQISPNALSEFRVVTGAMKAEYGRNGGAVIEAVTRSGGNAFHGGAEEVFRNTSLNATPFFQNVTPGPPTFFTNGLKRKPQWNTNDFDANFGGPIIRDKTFFFVSYLGFRRRQGVTSSATVFTAADRAAILQYGTSGRQGGSGLSSSGVHRQHPVLIAIQHAGPRPGTAALRSSLQRS